MTSSDPDREIQGPADATVFPRYANRATFARLPRLDEVGHADVTIVGMPFDSGTTYRPGARFGPNAVREGSRLLRPYHPAIAIEPFSAQQVADAGDCPCTPFDIKQAIREMESYASDVFNASDHLLSLGGDHTVALPLLRAVNKRFGPVAVIHFDAHLDTWEGHFGAEYNHGTPFRRASEEGLLLRDMSVHVGTRGPIFARQDLADDAMLGFEVIDADRMQQVGFATVISRIRERVRDAPVYISVDIDVLDPAYAPGTGTPEAGGLSSRELLTLLRGLGGIRVVSADVVEVAPAYDHSEVTAIAAAHVGYELLGLFVRATPNDEQHP